jgi:hypothetical protein
MTKEFIRQLFLYDNDEDIKEFIQKYFSGDIQLAINFLEKNKIFDEDENVKDFFLEEYPNAFLLHRLNTNEEETLQYIIDLFTDVTEDGGRIYMRINSREDLAKLFKGSSYSRYSTPNEVAERVLQDDHYEWFGFDSSIEISTIVDDLNEKNLSTLRQIFLKNNEGSEDFTLDDEMFEVSKETMDQITDEELAELIEQDADLRSNLLSLYNNAQEYSYSDELWEEVNGGLKEFFKVDKYFFEEPFKVKRVDGSEITRYNNKVDITNIFYDAVLKGLEDNQKYDEPVFGDDADFETMLIELLDEDFNGGEIDFSVPDYADYSKTIQNMNELFNDYV